MPKFTSSSRHISAFRIFSDDVAVVVARHLLKPSISYAASQRPRTIPIDVSVLIVEGMPVSEMAVVTFGGAYAVLASVAQRAVENYNWLRPGETLGRLGMAETTFGQLIMVIQFVGCMAAYRDPGALNPMVAGSLHGLLTTWVTFTPCFLWIFLGAPFIKGLRGNKSLSGTLSVIMAAVVGVILNLAVWFALQTWLPKAVPIRAAGLSFDVPVPTSLDSWAGRFCRWTRGPGRSRGGRTGRGTDIGLQDADETQSEIVLNTEASPQVPGWAGNARAPEWHHGGTRNTGRVCRMPGPLRRGSRAATDSLGTAARRISNPFRT